jgi:hypothetical protein
VAPFVVHRAGQPADSEHPWAGARNVVVAHGAPINVESLYPARRSAAAPCEWSASGPRISRSACGQGCPLRRPPTVTPCAGFAPSADHPYAVSSTGRGPHRSWRPFPHWMYPRHCRHAASAQFRQLADVTEPARGLNDPPFLPSERRTCVRPRLASLRTTIAASNPCGGIRSNLGHPVWRFPAGRTDHAD